VLHYTACGLTIASDVEIPGLPAVERPCVSDLLVSIGDHAAARLAVGAERVRYVSSDVPPCGEPQLRVWTGSTGAHRFRYSDGTEFIVNAQATSVSLTWEPPLTAGDAAVYLLGPVLGFIMRLRGVVSLHASAVATDRGAVVFVGEAGCGKSTTAAACATLGYPVLSDDLLPIRETPETFWAHPSHPRLTVWPDTVRGLFGAADQLPALTPTYDKRYLDLQARRHFRDSPLPIAVIHVIGARHERPHAFGVKTLRPTAALMSLVSNTYGNYLLDSSMRALEFDVLSRLVHRVPVREITFADDIAQLFECCPRLLDSETIIAAGQSYE